MSVSAGGLKVTLTRADVRGPIRTALTEESVRGRRFLPYDSTEGVQLARFVPVDDRKERAAVGDRLGRHDLGTLRHAEVPETGLHVSA